MKVLLVSPFSEKKVGGIGTWTRSVLDYCATDKDVEIFFLNTHFDLKRIIKGNFYVLKRILIGSIDSLCILLKLFYSMVIYMPDVVHYTSSASFGLFKDQMAIFIIKVLFQKKMVIHWHFGRIPELFVRCDRECIRFKKVHNHCDASIVLDIQSKNVMIENGLDNIYVVPNAVTQSVSHIAEELDIDMIQNRRLFNNVLYVGHILPTKGVVELVKACVSIENVYLTMVGPDMLDIVGELRTIANKRDNGSWITFTGELSREEVLPYYMNCSIFCLPSYTEGFPYVILESMSFGCPIIATRVGAIPEMLSNRCGVIVESKNIIELRNAIKMLLNKRDLALELGRNANKKVIEEYSIETVFNAYKEIWSRVLWE